MLSFDIFVRIFVTLDYHEVNIQMYIIVGKYLGVLSLMLLSMRILIKILARPSATYVNEIN